MNPPSFIVPQWLKAVFFWFSVVVLFGLIYSQIDKRIVYRRLFLAHFMQASAVGKSAIPFHLSNGPGGQDISLDTHKGQWRLVHFWATWCPPCREEMPSLVALAKHLGADLKIMAISVDEDWSEVQKFFAKKKPNFDVLWDREAKVSKAYNIDKYPETFLISPNGQIVAHFAGPRPWDRAEAIDYIHNLIHKNASIE